MDLGNVIGKSWDEYRKNFKQLFLLTLVFIGIPTVLAFLIFFMFGINYSEQVNIEELKLSAELIAAISLIGIIGAIFYFIYEAGLIKESLKGFAKFDFHRVTHSGKRNFWKFVWFGIVAMFFLCLLFMALIIPGIIFGIYWSLAIFVYFDSNKTVMESLRTSFHMVKGNWWRIFGYTIVLVLIFGLVGVITELLGYLVTEFVAGFINTLFTAPFAILFYKNIYLGLRGKGKDKIIKKKKK